MTTKLRTGLLLGFTAMMAMASLSGCIIETTSGPKVNCADERYFQVYWSVALDANTQPWACNQAGSPAFSEVRLNTNNGTFPVGRECRLTNYMNFRFDYAGSTQSAIPAGTYVISADLIGADGVTPLSSASGAGTNYTVGSCDPLTVAFAFELQ